MIISAKDKNSCNTDIVLFGSGIDSTIAFLHTLYRNLTEDTGRETKLIRVKNGRKDYHSSKFKAYQAVFDRFSASVKSNDKFSLSEVWIEEFSLEPEYSEKNKIETKLSLISNTSEFYIPFRNTRLVLSLLDAHYVANKKWPNSVTLGVHKATTYKSGESHVSYADCTSKYISSLKNMVLLETGVTEILSPFVEWEKSKIVAHGENLVKQIKVTFPDVYTDLGSIVNFENTISCYFPEFFLGSYVNCGSCPACIDRMLAFKRAECKDSTYYKDLGKQFELLKEALY